MSNDTVLNEELFLSMALIIADKNGCKLNIVDYDLKSIDIDGDEESIAGFIEDMSLMFDATPDGELNVSDL